VAEVVAEEIMTLRKSTVKTVAQVAEVNLFMLLHQILVAVLEEAEL
jgi:hypothetical protein